MVIKYSCIFGHANSYLGVGRPEDDKDDRVFNSFSDQLNSNFVGTALYKLVPFFVD